MRFFANAPFPRLSRFGLVALLLVAAALLLSGPGSVLGQSGPSMTGVAVTSAPASGDTYTLGETIRVTLTFSEMVDVSGSPRLNIDMDPAHWGEKWVNYESGSGTTALTFAHQVVEPNISTQGIAVLANTLELNGGTIRSTASTDAVLSHTGLGHDANHKVDWQANRPATGAPTITGTAQVGETLTVDTSGISDEDGLSNAAFSYQWLADDANIAGATGNTYTLAAADEGKAVKVRVSFTDDAGNNESLTSAATARVVAGATQPNRAPVVDEDADQYAAFITAGWAPRGIWVSKRFEGIFSDPDGDELTYTVSLADDRGEFVDQIRLEEDLRRVFIRFDTDKDWYAINSSLPNPLNTTVTLTATDPDGLSASLSGDFKTIWDSPATGAPTIAGMVRVGETLTADTSDISDGNGLVNAIFSYQWMADDADISGATGDTYTLAGTDEGKAVKVRVSFTDDAGYDETLTSAATAAVVPGRTYRSQLGEVLVELSLRRPAPAAPEEDTSGQSSGTRSASGQSETPQTTSIVYVVDDSGSMDGDFPEVRAALRLVRGTAMDNTKVALIAFGHESKTVFGLTGHSTDATDGPWTDAHIDSFGGRLGGTEFEAPLENAKALLDADDADNKRIIFLTDAQSNIYSWFYSNLNWLRIPEAVQGIKDAGITVDTIGFGDHYSKNFPRLEQIATDTGGEHRVVPRPRQGTTNDPAVTAASISDILEGTVADNTATLFLVDYSASLRRMWASDWHDPNNYKWDYTLIDGALNAAATKAADASGTGRQVGLATFLGETVSTTLDTEGHPEYKVIHAIGSSSLSMPFRYRGISGSVGTLPGSGSTDIDHALQQAYSTISGVTATNKRVVLITDGISAVDVQDSTLDSYKNNAAVSLDVVAWGDHADRVQLKTWADSASGSFTVAKTPPLAPIRFGAIDGESSTYGEASVLVGWVDAEDPAITKHQYRWYISDGNAGEYVDSGWTDMPGTGSSDNNWYVITGFKDLPASYHIHVRAVRGDTPGAHSHMERVPWHPDLEVEAEAGDGQIDLSWRTKLDGTVLKNERRDFKEYRYSLREGEDGVWSDWTTIPDANHDRGSHTITGLTNGTTYTVAMAKLLEGIIYEELGPLSYYSSSFGTASARPNYQPTGAPTITGTVQVGETLTVDTSGISDADGLDNVIFYYGWFVHSQTSDRWHWIMDDLPSASNAMTVAEEGSTVKVEVYFYDDEGNRHKVTSAPTATVVAATLPHVDGVAETSSPIEDDTYGMGETIRITLTFSEAVDVTGTPRLKISSGITYDGGEGRWANYESGSGTASLTFAYEVAEPDYYRGWFAAMRNTLELNGGTIKSTATESDAYLAHKQLWAPTHGVDWEKDPPSPTGLSVDTEPGSLEVSVDWDDVPGASYYLVHLRADGPNKPLNEVGEFTSSTAQITVPDYGTWVVRVAPRNDVNKTWGDPATLKFTVAAAGTEVTSTPASGDTYGLGETIRVTLTFGEEVDVTGTPRLKIKMDPDYGEKWANYESGSGTASLVFAYTVAQPNISTQGIAVPANTLEMNGGTIKSTTTEAAADLSHTGLAHDANHKVDWK